MTAQTSQSTNQPASQPAITPDLVRKVSEKVYALWLKESEIERERYRIQQKRGKR